MNEYNYDYLKMYGMIPSNNLGFMNTIPQNMMNNIDMDNNIKISNILDPTEGFIKGNMFGNLYSPYRNYKPGNLNPKNEKEALLMSVQQYNFVLMDLKLYLDVFPDDKNVINLYKQSLKIFHDIKDDYEKKYGPLDSKSMYVIDENWKWDNSPWPWEVK